MHDDSVLSAGLSTGEAALMIGCHQQTLSRAQEGRNRHYPQAACRIGNRYRFNADDVAAFLRGEK
jgi:hypothetical protein